MSSASLAGRVTGWGMTRGDGVRPYIFIPSREPDLCMGSYRADGILGDEGDYSVHALVEGFCSRS